MMITNTIISKSWKLWRDTSPLRPLKHLANRVGPLEQRSTSPFRPLCCRSWLAGGRRCSGLGVRRYDHVAVYDDDNIKKSKLARQPTRSSAGPVCYSPVPAQGRLRLRLQTQRGTRMASARRGESTTDDAMAVEMGRQSSGHHSDSSDNDGEAADFSPILHKKEMLERKYDDDDDDDGAFSQTESEGPP